MEIVLIMSQEHTTLPKAEVESILRAENIPFKIKKEYEGIITLEIPDEKLEAFKKIEKRFSYVHEVSKLLINTDEQGLMDEIQNYPWKNLIKKDYAVRIKRMNKSQKFNTTDLEWKMGGIINDMMPDNVNVNLKDPETFIRTIFINDEVMVCERIFKVAKKHFHDLKPHKRPFFYPGSMSPKLARCMVNLTMVGKGDRVLDPFCGTGGILIEAGIIGASVVGADIDERMVEGTVKNLEYCGIKDYEVFQSDARHIKLPYKVDAIVMDPPYGISASTGGEESQKLYNQSMHSLQNLVKDDGLVCMATPHYMDMNEVIKDTSFEIIDQHHIRMHKSLTRVISLLKKV
ncbi:Ribosomal RNA large subunit methyltransferase K/L [anaerobic digester metagenome]